MRKIIAIIAFLAVLSLWGQDRKRRMTPLNTPATETQAVNETANDTARINAKRRAQSVPYTDAHGKVIFVDTITGEEWTDSTAIKNIARKMQQPLFHAASVGLNIWDPVMRIFGQDYGIASAWAELSLYNRFKPVIEVGLGTASHEGPNNNYRYRSPLSVFFKIGVNYNFLFNSDPDYQLYAGVHYGFSPFSYAVDDVVLESEYWGETSKFNIPSQKTTAGWFEFGLGLRVKIWGPISAGWEFKYHTLAHSGKCKYGDPWYIPGYGTRGSSITGSFSISYTLPLSGLNKKAEDAVIDSESEAEGKLPPPEITDESISE